MKFDEILHRLTGISCPIFGVSWTPPESDRKIARRIVTYLEDRRVLFNPYMMEDPHHCVHSVLEMRDYLTKELQKVESKKELSDTVRAMRLACRKFLDSYNSDDPDRRGFRGRFGPWGDVELFQALGELRGVFGVQLAKLAALYGLDVEDELASILPAGEDGADDEDSPEKGE